ncbi:MAG TPA: hypothetical protein VMM78_02105 [Thermomicrobiales bacterium]|nr:hypothetical protein [Thermomicrobiales bacterium]
MRQRGASWLAIRGLSSLVIAMLTHLATPMLVVVLADRDTGHT